MAEYIIDVPYNIKCVDGEPTLVGFSVREEIIRCRDCGSCNSECKCTNPRFCYDNGAIMHCPKVDPNGFCAWAEMRQ